MLKLMSNTKWDELRLAMYGLGPLSPRWRTKDVENGCISDWDCEWFYHFRNGGYKSIEWVEIATESEVQRNAVLTELAKVHVPGLSKDAGFRVIGYAELGVEINFLSVDL